MASGKEPKIKRAPAWIFDILATVSKLQKNGKEAILRFSKWTLAEEMVADTAIGDASFVEYIVKCCDEAKCDKSIRANAGRLFPLSEVDVGEFACIKSKGMCFDVRVFDAEGAGRLFLMDMTAPGGLMKMETATFTPTELDAPILSVDVVSAFGRSTLVLELYDTTISHPDFSALGAIKEKYEALPSYDPGDHPYYRFCMPESAYKQGRRIEDAVRAMAQEYYEAYFRHLESCDSVDPASKKQKNAEFSESLFLAGGPAVNQFKQMIGSEKTQEFLMKYMYCSR